MKTNLFLYSSLVYTVVHFFIFFSIVTSSLSSCMESLFFDSTKINFCLIRIAVCFNCSRLFRSLSRQAAATSKHKICMGFPKKKLSSSSFIPDAFEYCIDTFSPLYCGCHQNARGIFQKDQCEKTNNNILFIHFFCHIP